jgi:outer membrane protein assembly factor BamB
VQAADSFIAVDRLTGQSRWRCLERPQKEQGSYSSPDFATVSGRAQLLVANIDDIAGVDSTTGQVLWKKTLDSYDAGCILAPIAYRDGVFTSTRASHTGYYPIDRLGDQLMIRDGWKNKLAAYMSSPVVINDHAFMHLRNGRFACVALEDGTVNWISPRPFGRYCSMVWYQDRILALTDEGELLLIEAATDEFRLLDSRQVAEQETWGHLAVAGQSVLVRERDAIVVFDWREARPE